ncbi:hypothetical protein SO802_008569 [Lithocarpus litseifolius]|uniref:F-box protein At3g26010-like beta-propeller domain-containing protein n=1 Tax=Lithocarpus litseifolius TaxID=425828 RepID=A0AAW2DB77_9ROSI
MTQERLTLRPTDCHVGNIFGLAFYPFGSSAKMIPCFKVVSIQRPKHNQNSYSFVIYSSETGKWKTSPEVCYCKDELYENKHIYVNGRFYWLTSNQNIITFEVDEELSGVITVPGPKWLDRDVRLACLGDSVDAQTFHDEVVYLSIRGNLPIIFFLKNLCNTRKLSSKDCNSLTEKITARLNSRIAVLFLSQTPNSLNAACIASGCTGQECSCSAPLSGIKYVLKMEGLRPKRVEYWNMAVLKSQILNMFAQAGFLWVA